MLLFLSLLACVESTKLDFSEEESQTPLCSNGSGQSTATDSDCDGVPQEEDCDDTDPNSTTQAEDADCDGLLTNDDCDDSDPNSASSVNDRDCDGVLTAIIIGNGERHIISSETSIAVRRVLRT